MSRGRPRHQGSRRRAYSGRQREVRERHERLTRHESDWIANGVIDIEAEPAPAADPPAWSLSLRGRATAA